MYRAGRRQAAAARRGHSAVGPRTAVLLAAMLVAAALALPIAIVPPVATAPPAGAATTPTQLGDLDIIAVDDGEPARILFAAPPRLATRTLTDADLEVAVDGEPQQETLRRLSANDLEIAVVVDTTVDADDLRTLQGALVELTLELPQGVTMTVVDAQGDAAPPAAVPGPAIASIRSLRAGTADALDAAVEQTTAQLDASTRNRTALVVMATDLSRRLDPIDDRPLGSLTFLIAIGGDDPVDLLGPRAAGTAVTVDSAADVLGAADDVSATLRSLYLAEIPVSDPAAGTATLALSTAAGTTTATTVALDPNTLRPTFVDPPTQASAPDGDAQPAADPSTGEPEESGLGGWVPWLLLGGLLLAAVVALLLWRSRARGRATPVAGTPVTHAAGTDVAGAGDSVPAAVMPEQPLSPVHPPRRRAATRPQPPQRPIAKLAPQTREALARAHLGLRQLALASRETSGIVPDDMFRLTEARASAALAGFDHPLPAVLLDLLNDEHDETTVMVRRAAQALSTGWQHTSQRNAAPPAVVEINALLDPGGTRRPGRPTAPVRALNPLVEIGLEHMVLAAEPDTHAGMVARSVTAVGIMRAARLARPVLTLSPYLLEHAERYHAACAADPADAPERDDWLQLLCDTIARRSQVSVGQLTRMRRIRARYRDAAPDLAAARLIDVLLATPVLDGDVIAQNLSIALDEAEAVGAAAQRSAWLAPHPVDEGVWVATDVVDIFASMQDAAAGSAM